MGWSTSDVHLMLDVLQRQDLLSSTVLSAPPHFPRPIGCHFDKDDIPAPRSFSPEFRVLAECGTELLNDYCDMRHLAEHLASFDHVPTHAELKPLKNVRDRIENSLLSLYIRKPKAKMQDLDYLMETSRLAALIFLSRLFDGFNPVVRQLRSQMKELLLEKESHIVREVNPQMTWGYYPWALFMGGIHCLDNDDDVAFFAKRIARSTRTWQAMGFRRWPEILNLMKKVGWMDALRGPECERLGRQVERFVGSAAEDGGGLTGDGEMSGWPAEVNMLLTAWSLAAKG